MSIEESLLTERKTGTADFVAPEALKTGIFTEKCDIYSLGRVLWRVFYIQIMYLYESNDRNEKIDSAHDDFYKATRDMIKKSPAERPKVLDSLKAFHQIIETYAGKSFEIYGSDRLMASVQLLLESETKSPFQPIKTNI